MRLFSFRKLFCDFIVITHNGLRMHWEETEIPFAAHDLREFCNYGQCNMHPINKITTQGEYIITYCDNDGEGVSIWPIQSHSITCLV